MLYRKELCNIYDFRIILYSFSTLYKALLKFMKKKKVKEIGITALYERLSRDDDGDGDSNSIVHQKQMLEAYAKEHGFVNLRHYTDDGWSGASFDRPAWNELVAGKGRRNHDCHCKRP